MDWKEFFKPGAIKAILTIILFFVSAYLSHTCMTSPPVGASGEGGCFMGFPLNTKLVGTLDWTFPTSFASWITGTPHFVIINIVLLYIISCAIAFLFHRKKR